MPVKLLRSLKDLKSSNWSQYNQNDNPFLKKAFLTALENSNSVCGQSGWNPLYFIDENDTQKSMLYSFAKTHSYGEYIFDWQFANAYQQHQLDYYPKLTSMVPFTPATTPHFLSNNSGANFDALMQAYEDHYHEFNYSSSHFLFITENEIALFENSGYQIRNSMQYHFINKNYQNFDDYLGALKSKKRKTVKRERKMPENITINKIIGNALTESHANEMYGFYISTIENKYSNDYLTLNFFVEVFNNMKEQILYVQAVEEGIAIAGALFFYGKNRLYGRYWGSNKHIPYLHFELCFYQGIEFCIDQKIQVFEAGAQGEHKIPRGFRPMLTYSAHKFKHPQFGDAIGSFIEDEKGYLANAIDELNKKLPFREL